VNKLGTNKFTAVYEVFKDEYEGENTYELTNLSVLFEKHREEDMAVGEYTPTYDQGVVGVLESYPSGSYRVFVIGKLVYWKDYYGEHSVSDEINYVSVEEYK
jgi:hypothetical protein